MTEEKRCAKPGCARPVRMNPTGRKSKYCSEKHANITRLQRKRRKDQVDLHEQERRERVSIAERWVAQLEAKACGDIPPPHTPNEDGTDCTCCDSPFSGWPLHQPNALTAEEQDWLAQQRGIATSSGMGPRHKPGCDGKGSVPGCCAPVIEPPPPRRCSQCGEEMTGELCDNCQEKKSEEWQRRLRELEVHG